MSKAVLGMRVSDGPDKPSFGPLRSCVKVAVVGNFGMLFFEATSGRSAAVRSPPRAGKCCNLGR